MATHDSTRRPHPFPSAAQCVGDPKSAAARVAREAAYVESWQQMFGVVGPVDFHESPHDRLTRRLAQASAMLQMTIGQFRDGFSMANDTMQENYLWTVSDLVDAALGDALLVNGLEREPSQGGSKAVDP